MARTASWPTGRGWATIDWRAAGHKRTAAAAAAVSCVSLALYPVFSGATWFWAGVGATVSVALAGTLTRLRRLPVLVCLVGELAGLLLYLNLIFGHSWSLLGVIPTPWSLAHVWSLAGQGLSETNRYAPPVPELTGMMLLAAAGIGLMAILTDLIAVRLRSAALAGIPLLLMFTEPFTLSISRSWLGTTTVFCFATAGYLTLLGTEGRERIREWEQASPVAAVRRRDELRRPPDTRALAAAGRRVGVASVVLALFVPMFVPGLHVTRLFGGGPAVSGGLGGGAGVGLPDPQTQVSGELRESAPQPVLSYTSTAGIPGYLQVFVTDNLTPTGWQFTRQQALLPGGVMPAPQGLDSGFAPSSVSPGSGSGGTAEGSGGTAEDSGGTADGSGGSPFVSTHISISKNLAQSPLAALPAPYPPVRVSGAGDVAAAVGSLMLFANGVQLAGLSYSVTSLDVEPGEQALAHTTAPPKDIARPYTEVPQSYESLRTLAQGITANATTPYAKAVALQDWLADGNFTYSLNAPAVTNAAGLTNFLDNSHSGYCQQFSFAMAVLARLLGIPARIATGFTQGTRQRDGSWLVTTHDAHAWPELYFQGYGWLRFEPTPGGSGGQGTALTPSYTEQQTAPQETVPTAPLPNPAASTSDTGGNADQANQNRNRALLEEGGNGGTALPTASPAGPNPWVLAGLSLLGLLMVAMAVPGCARLVIRRLRWRAAARDSAHADSAHGDTAHADRALAAAAWRELRDDLRDYGTGYVPSETPRALAARVTAKLELTGEAAAALRRVAMAAERARYAARPASGSTLREDSTIVRRAIAAAVPRRARWLARTFPASVVAPATFLLDRLTDVFGRLASPPGPSGRRRRRRAAADAGLT